jgi:hypothetical protein
MKVIKCFKIVILFTICILNEFKMGGYKIEHEHDSSPTGHLANEEEIQENQKNLTRNDIVWFKGPKVW